MVLEFTIHYTINYKISHKLSITTTQYFRINVLNYASYFDSFLITFGLFWLPVGAQDPT